MSFPFLFDSFREGLAAYQPGTVNGVSLGRGHFAAPKPFGPVVGGTDIFEGVVEKNLGRLGMAVHWVDDWSVYHVNFGETHCGTNVRRALPTTTFFWGDVR